MVVHGAEIGEAETHALSQLGDKRRGGREDLGVQREDIEVRHLVGVGAGGARNNFPFAEHEGEIAIRLRVLRFFGVNDEQAHQAEGHLSHFIVM